MCAPHLRPLFHYFFFISSFALAGASQDQPETRGAPQPDQQDEKDPFTDYARRRLSLAKHTTDSSPLVQVGGPKVDPATEIETHAGGTAETPYLRPKKLASRPWSHSSEIKTRQGVADNIIPVDINDRFLNTFLGSRSPGKSKLQWTLVGASL
jgi:hypothetical protein